jgi:hypothetical protein
VVSQERREQALREKLPVGLEFREGLQSQSLHFSARPVMDSAGYTTPVKTSGHENIILALVVFLVVRLMPTALCHCAQFYALLLHSDASLAGMEHYIDGYYWRDAGPRE